MLLNPASEDAKKAATIRLKAISMRISCAAIYGGDCIVRCDGSYAIIDFNDWPSFSVCRQAAARAIAKLVLNDKRIATI